MNPHPILTYRVQTTLVPFIFFWDPLPTHCGRHMCKYAPKAIDTLQDVYESGLPVEIMDCLEMEGHISQDTDPIVKHIYDNRIVTPFTPWLQGYFSNILNPNLW